MLAARRPLPLVLVRGILGVWFFKIPLTVGQFWAPKGGPGAKPTRSKNTDPGIRRDSPRIGPDFATTRTSGFTLPSRAHLQDDARSKQTPSNYYYYYYHYHYHYYYYYYYYY